MVLDVTVASLGWAEARVVHAMCVAALSFYRRHLLAALSRTQWSAAVREETENRNNTTAARWTALFALHGGTFFSNVRRTRNVLELSNRKAACFSDVLPLTVEILVLFAFLLKGLSMHTGAFSSNSHRVGVPFVNYRFCNVCRVSIVFFFLFTLAGQSETRPLPRVICRSAAASC